jgi:hypothetical protein
MVVVVLNLLVDYNYTVKAITVETLVVNMLVVAVVVMLLQVAQHQVVFPVLVMADLAQHY